MYRQEIGMEFGVEKCTEGYKFTKSQEKKSKKSKPYVHG